MNQPKIVNIYNFIRNSDPRIEDSEGLLFEATKQQLALLEEVQLPATFALQYDALIQPRYQSLLKGVASRYEIGAWWEFCRPHVERAGLAWRGRWDWDWHADVAFAPGYSPEERRKLIDVYMADFKAIFGFHPRSVGSWFIDEVSLGYMAEAYGVIASCNCKDQIGTDGYTLWGGYWNQAYYPSRLNSYMPAQTAEGQIDLPIFRMLGSDPIHQYDAFMGGNISEVVTLEPAYAGGGGDADWVRWFFDLMINQPCLSFAYAQVGQENSFGWPRQQQGYEDQIRLLAALVKAGKIRVEPLEASGRWFLESYRVTPPTAVVAPEDRQDASLGSAWFNSRFYRVNFWWKAEEFFLRDLHLFDQGRRSQLFDEAVKGSSLEVGTLPIMDGCRWSSIDSGLHRAGFRLVKLTAGRGAPLRLDAPAQVTEGSGDELHLSLSLEHGAQRILVRCGEDFMEWKEMESSGSKFFWGLEMAWSQMGPAELIEVLPNKLIYRLEGKPYALNVVSGKAGKMSGENRVLISADSQEGVRFSMSPES